MKINVDVSLEGNFQQTKKKKKREEKIKDEQWFQRVASWKQTLIRQSSCSTASIIRIWRMQNRQWRARVKLCMPRINGPQYANVYKVSGTFCQPLFPGLWKPDRELAYPTSLSAFHSIHVTFRETKPKFPLHISPITDRRFLLCQPIVGTTIFRRKSSSSRNEILTSPSANQIFASEIDRLCFNDD